MICKPKLGQLRATADASRTPADPANCWAKQGNLVSNREQQKVEVSLVPVTTLDPWNSNTSFN